MTKVLLIEDEAPLREMVADELSAQGYEVLEASNGAEGLEQFLAGKPDLVLCDRAMAGMSGYDLLEKIRAMDEECNKVPFIFLTALTDVRDREAVEHLNPADYLEKPVDFDLLEEKIKFYLNK